MNDNKNFLLTDLTFKQNTVLTASTLTLMFLTSTFMNMVSFSIFALLGWVLALKRGTDSNLSSVNEQGCNCEVVTQMIPNTKCYTMIPVCNPTN